MRSPTSVGFSATGTPAASSASIFACGRALPAGDDRAGVAHLLAGGRGDTRDVGHDRLGHLGGDELGRLFFGRAADLADHDHGLRLGVGLETAAGSR